MNYSIYKITEFLLFIDIAVKIDGGAAASSVTLTMTMIKRKKKKKIRYSIKLIPEDRNSDN